MSINFYFIRHSIAEPANNKIIDKERRLTVEGKRILEYSAEYFKKYIHSIDIIVSSPIYRAIETSEIIRKIFKVEKEIIEDNSLLNGGNIEELLLLGESLAMKNIAMVGHQPDISQHISKLICSSEAGFKIPPASIAKISFDGNPSLGKGVLEFLLPPLQFDN